MYNKVSSKNIVLVIAAVDPGLYLDVDQGLDLVAVVQNGEILGHGRKDQSRGREDQDQDQRINLQSEISLNPGPFLILSQGRGVLLSLLQDRDQELS